jgi:hypothetical protein
VALPRIQPRKEALDVPATIPDRWVGQPAFLGHPSREVVEQAGERPRTNRREPERAREEQPLRRGPEKALSIGAGITRSVKIGPQLLDPIRRSLKVSRAGAKAAMGMQFMRGDEERRCEFLQMASRIPLLGAVHQVACTGPCRTPIPGQAEH